MSLDLDIKIKKNIKLKDVLINCRSELINLTKEMNIPEIQSYVLNDGFKRFPNDGYVLTGKDMIIIYFQNYRDEVSLIITEFECYPPYILKDKAGIWAGVSVQSANNQKLLLAAGVALSLSKLCGSNIIDERMVWSKNRESTYNTFLEGLKNNKIICTNI